MDYKSDEVFRNAAMVAALGWKVMKVWGVRDDLSCTCPKGRDCKNAGKHPVDHAWQTTATTDENIIAEWFENATVRLNYGVRMGNTSGIVDVEADDETSLRVLEEFGLDKIYTTAYRGSRGPHYLFQWQEELPASGVVKVNGLEVRIGGGDKGTQSVFPGSWHKTGVQYKWIEGRSPDDVMPARLPQKFLEKIFENSNQGKGGAVAQARQLIAEGRKVGEGQRHAHLVGAASDLCGLIRPHYTENRRQWVIGMLRKVNAYDCRPPKGDDEVVAIANSQFNFYMARAEDRRNERPLERTGLVYNVETGTWDPGEWTLTVVHSDPKAYKLSILNPNAPGERAEVYVDVHTFRRSDLLATAITNVCDFDVANPSKTLWAKIWDGESVRDEAGQLRNLQGLRVRMLDDKGDEYPPAECKTYSRTAGCLIQYLKRFSSSNAEDGELAESGTPQWVTNKRTGQDELLLKWESMWEAVQKRFPFIANKDVIDLRRRLLTVVSPGLDRFPDRLETINGHRSRWIVWNDSHIRALERLSVE